MKNQDSSAVAPLVHQTCPDFCARQIWLSQSPFECVTPGIMLLSGLDVKDSVHEVGMVGIWFGRWIPSPNVGSFESRLDP
uniref:Uncharacterized protein n=1 Tax=Mycena chlorophos TaxID=658473 RepID=A0ABQ0L9Y1_MYCCL|nr:predicted protein [Mycena chlorophos]